MSNFDVLAYLTLVVIVITICVEIYMIRYRTYLSPKKHFSGRFWDPIRFPEEGEDARLCDLCHGRLGPEKIAVCACGKRFHPECISQEMCPGCGNDLRHMRVRLPDTMACPICLEPMDDGFCGRCGITVPHADGTFRCPDCGGVVMTSHPVCRKCGAKYAARVTKGYMNRVR